LFSYLRPFGTRSREQIQSRVRRLEDERLHVGDWQALARTAGSVVRGGMRTLTARVPRTPETVALIEVSPVAFAVTSPDADTLATEALSLAHVAVLVRFSVVPFDSVAVAVSWAVAPFP
jgi:hypothetical protein